MTADEVEFEERLGSIPTDDDDVDGDAPKDDEDVEEVHGDS